MPYKDLKEVMRLSETDLRKEVRKLQKSVSQRLRRLKAAGFDVTPATKALSESGGRITTKGTRQQLMRERGRAINFLESRTATVSGIRAQQEYVSRELGGDWMTEEQSNKFWRAYSELRSRIQGREKYVSQVGNYFQRNLMEYYRNHPQASEETLISYLDELVANEERREQGLDYEDITRRNRRSERNSRKKK